MSYLLDTQIALWLIADDPRLRPEAREILGGAGSDLIFHQVSTWEIQIKYDLGKLPLPGTPEKLLPKWIEDSGFRRSGIEDSGIFMLSKLPPIHRDPFDRLLVAHAIVNGWTIVTADETVKRYPVAVLDS